LPFYERVNDPIQLARLYSTIGMAYDNMHAVEKSIEYCEKASSIAPDDEYVISDLADAYLGARQYEKAILFYEKALHICTQLNNQYLMGSNNYKLGASFISLNDLVKAEIHTRQSLEINKKIGSSFYSASLLQFGKLEALKGNFIQAEKHIKEALQIATENDFLEAQRYCYHTLAELALAQHNYHQNIEYWNKTDSVERLQARETSLRAAEEMSAKYETEKKELEIERQQQVIDRQNLQRGLLAGGIAVSIVILALLWYMLRLRNRRNAALTEMNATKDRFFSIISHDLKNPAVAQCDALRAMIENAGLWDADTISDYYHELLKSAEGQVELLYNLLNWAQIQTGRMIYTPDRFTLSDLLSDITLIRNMAKNKGVALVLPQSQVALITGDRNMLSTVVRNLLTNAVKFTPAGGTVTLDISGAHTGAPLQYTISVSDTGVGMTKEQIASLFRLDSADSSIGTAGERGSGLGLIVCKELLEKHGSALHVESEVGKGSRFWFTISA